ncbi:MAG: ATP-binding protein [Salinibacter sp.]|uniref:ATP-binding protein n=1 Tax=Salinibacter sp. TaxID=2065818 RepID=UPI0035D49E45
MSSISDRLRTARGQLFVGRSAERAQFRFALTADALPFNVMHVHGPGGVGKSLLLQAFERCCHEEEVPAYRLDVQNVEPTPTAFRAALRDKIGIDDDTDILSALAAHGERTAVLVDAYETLEALDGWLRTQFLPDLPKHVLFVFAGRSEPAPEWRTDPGWRALVKIIPLRNLDRETGRTLLQRRDVPTSEHETILNFTHGHPLALSLVADLMEQRGDSTFESEETHPDIVETLVGQFVQKVPSPAHRAALEAASLVPYTTEALLQATLDTPNVHALFEWLQGLSFVSPGERGLELHDLTRDALAADLRWRNPEWHDDLHERARQFYIDRLKDVPDREVPDVLTDLTFLLRDHPLIQPFFDQLRSQWSEAHGLLEDELDADDSSELVQMIEEHEGKASAQILKHWLDRQPEGVRVYRTPEGTPVGFLFTLFLDEMDATDRAEDPVATQAWEYLEARAPLRPGERASIFRFWTARDSYQDISPVQSLIFIRQVRHYLSTPNLAFTVLVCREPEVWDQLFAYAGMTRLEGADGEVGPHTYALYGHDWRASPPGQWLDQLADRGFEVTTDAASSSDDRLIVLSRTDFAEAVTDALKQLHRPDQLRENPLLYSRVVSDEVGDDDGKPARIDALQTLLEETTEDLARDPRDEKYHKAVHRTYVQPAPTQEKAAEQLGVPFSTFRRHLNRGVERITEILWDEEISTSQRLSSSAN